MKRSIRYTLFMICFFVASTAWASTLTVTSIADSGPGSLRDTIAAASSGDVIVFGVTGTIIITSASIVIDKDLTINGPGAGNLTINLTGYGPVCGRTLCIDRNVVITDATLVGDGQVTIDPGGSLTIDNCVGSERFVPLGGGASLTIENSTFQDNVSQSVNSESLLTISNSVFVNNSFEIHGTTASITNSTFANGSVIKSLSSNVSITDSTFSGGFGEAIRSDSGLNISNSTFTGYPGSSFIGNGVIYAFDNAQLNLTNNTISGNSGSGVYFGGLSAVIKNTILSNNTLGNCSGATLPISQGHNLSDDGTCGSFFTQTGDMNNTPAGLDPTGLQNNGGPTQTIALLPSSPAVDAVPVSPINFCTDVEDNPITVDQRGTTRPQGSACDIGAFEYFASPFTSEVVMAYILSHSVESLPLPQGTKNSLTSKLSAAIASMNRGNVNSASGQLGAFTNEVNGLQSDLVLTPKQASSLTIPAQTIVQDLTGK